MGKFLIVAVASIVLWAALFSRDAVCEDVSPGGPPTGSQVATVATSLESGTLEGTVDADQYILGPGDVLQIGFWGDVNRSDRVVVNPDGDALVTPVGPLKVTGMTLAEARNVIKEKLAAYYRPSILSVSLVSIRSFQVHVVGMVERPGAFEVNAVTRVSQAVVRAGGLAPTASQRNIRVTRAGGELRADLTRYLLLGDNQMNPFLNDGDVVYVPPRSEQVHVYGSVYRAGAYEFIEGETLDALIDIAGGFKPEACLDSIEIERFPDEDPVVSRALFLSPEPETLKGFKVAPGDRIFVRSIQDWHRDAKVTVNGEVERPGVYVIQEGVETLSHLVARAGGLTDKASLAESRLVRGAYASTTFPIESEIEAIKDMESVLSEKDKQLVKTLSREPKGALSLRFEQIFAAKKGKRVDPPLYDGDLIEIPRASSSVRVSGQVENPGLVAFRPGEKSGYYIRQAGGFAPGADVGGTRLVTALNGQMMSPSGTEVRAGDIIWVPGKKEFSLWGAVKDIVQVLAGIATVYVVIDQATK